MAVNGVVRSGGARQASNSDPRRDDLPSVLGKLLASGKASKAAIERLSREPGALQCATPRQVQQAIEILQKGATLKQSEQAIVALLGSLPPGQRSECLRLLDGGSDRHTSDRLLSKDVDDPALNQRARALIGEARAIAPRDERVVLSDFDDTIVPSSDPRWRGRDAVPGARALLRALDVGPDGLGTVGDLHVVTGRDGFWAGTEKELRRAGVTPTSTAYSGVGNGLLSLFGNHAGIARDKQANIEKLIDRNPSSRALLIGDSVQLDPGIFANVLSRRADRVELALIHRVPGHPVPEPVASHPRVLVFDTYAEAARALHARGIISADQLDDVLADR